ncbi:MAG: DnaJ domain-containing protein [Candidatus Adiutrix sp.]
MAHNSYQELNLPIGASIGEIKAAFRCLAKTCHPDAAGKNQANIEKFIKGQKAYEHLLKIACQHNKVRRAAEQAQGKGTKPHSESGFRLDGRREVGLDIYCRILLLKPSDLKNYKITIPWCVPKACPSCLGTGRTLARLGQSSFYRPGACLKCEGTGMIKQNSHLEINLENHIKEKKIRLRKMGLYNIKTAVRGDLILEITWLESWPQAH